MLPIREEPCPEFCMGMNATLPREPMCALFSRAPADASDDAVVAELEDLAHPLDGPAHLDAVTAARRNYSCFEPYNEDAQEYARATALVPTSCQAEAVSALVELRSKAEDYKEKGDPESYFNAEQNALVAKNAELYYRTMVR